MVRACLIEENGTGADCAIVSCALKPGGPLDYVVDLVFSMRLLRIFLSGPQDIDPQAERFFTQKLKVRLAGLIPARFEVGNPVMAPPRASSEATATD
jgi:hypothetical protein